MDSVYKTYRNLKRVIRNNAASDIQRHFRGYSARKTLAGHRNQAGFVPMDTLDSFDGDFLDDSEADEFDEHTSKRSRDTDARSVDSDNMSEDEGMLMGTLTSGISGVGLHSPGSSQGTARYKELMGLKKTLKEKLKTFDDEFLKTHGHAPGKRDKEVMRPYYEQYHGVKIELQKIASALTPVALEDVHITSLQQKEVLGSRGESKLDTSLRSERGKADKFTASERSHKRPSSGVIANRNSGSASMPSSDKEWSSSSDGVDLKSYEYSSSI